jgi:hypothetical protein
VEEQRGACETFVCEGMVATEKDDIGSGVH